MFVARNIFLTTDTAPPASSFTGMTFNHCNQTGRNGPSFSTCDTYYTANNNAEYSALTNFAVSNGYQSFDIPAGTYSVTMDGACGGSTSNTQNSSNGGSGWNFFQGSGRKHARGARATFTLTVNSGLTLTMVIGQVGGNSGTGSSRNPGGGGGTFLTVGTYAQISAGTPTDDLICAVGGGGGYVGDYGGTTNNFDGEGQNNSNGATTQYNGGTNGNGSQSSSTNNSSGGAGYLTNASNGTTNGFGSTTITTAAFGFRNGAVGARHSSSTNGLTAQGGFGGGGGGSAATSRDEDKGGGGGYSGGSLSFDSYQFGGGGGSIIRYNGTGWSVTSGNITRGGGVGLNGQIIFS